MENKDGHEICELCNKEVEELISIEDGPNICEDCYEKGGYFQCEGCDLYIYPTEKNETQEGSSLCSDCYDECDEFKEGQTYQDYVGDCRFLLETVNYEVLEFEKALKEELTEKARKLLTKAFIEKDTEAKALFFEYYKYNPSSISEVNNENLEDFLEEWINSSDVVDALQACGYIVIKDIMI